MRFWLARRRATNITPASPDLTTCDYCSQLLYASRVRGATTRERQARWLSDLHNGRQAGEVMAVGVREGIPP
jgi:hypothetical protein